MANNVTQPLSQKIASFLPYALPVLGGVLGIIYVNLTPREFNNPAVWIAVGAAVGWAVSRVIVWQMNKRLIQGYQNRSESNK